MKMFRQSLRPYLVPLGVAAILQLGGCASFGTGDAGSDTAALAGAEPAAGSTETAIPEPERVVADLDEATPIAFTGNLTAAQRQFLRDNLPEVMAVSGGARVTVANVDLNDDGADEAIYIVHSGPYCGSGGVCNIWMFGQGPEGWRRINTDRDAGITMSMLPSHYQGYRDLVIHGSCYGEDCDFVIGWDGTLYHWLGRDAGRR